MPPIKRAYLKTIALKKDRFNMYAEAILLTIARYVVR